MCLCTHLEIGSTCAQFHVGESKDSRRWSKLEREAQILESHLSRSALNLLRNDAWLAAAGRSLLLLLLLLLLLSTALTVVLTVLTTARLHNAGLRKGQIVSLTTTVLVTKSGIHEDLATAGGQSAQLQEETASRWVNDSQVFVGEETGEPGRTAVHFASTSTTGRRVTAATKVAILREDTRRHGVL